MGQRRATACRRQRGLQPRRSRAIDRHNLGQLFNISPTIANTTQGLLRAKSQIVVLSDANILVNARCKRSLLVLVLRLLTIFLLVLDFRFKVDLYRLQRDLFDISIYNNNENICNFYQMLEKLYNNLLRVVFTSFYLFLKRFAASN